MPKNLLLADDSITIQKVVGITFAGEDFKITAVDNGEDAISRARELRPDVILADVVMPKRNGYEVCETVKGDPALQHIPVLLLAGTFEAFDESRARAARADGHIAKPFESQTLINKVKELLSGSPAQHAPAAQFPAAEARAPQSRPAPVAAPAPQASPGSSGPPSPAPPAPGAGRPPPAVRPPMPAAAPNRPGMPASAFPGHGLPPVGRPPVPGMPVGAARPSVPPPGVRPPMPPGRPPVPPARVGSPPHSQGTPPGVRAPAFASSHPPSPTAWSPSAHPASTIPAPAPAAAPMPPVERRDALKLDAPSASPPSSSSFELDWSDVDVNEESGQESAPPDAPLRPAVPPSRAPAVTAAAAPAAAATSDAPATAGPRLGESAPAPRAAEHDLASLVPSAEVVPLDELDFGESPFAAPPRPAVQPAPEAEPVELPMLEAEEEIELTPVGELTPGLVEAGLETPFSAAQPAKAEASPSSQVTPPAAGAATEWLVARGLPELAPPAAGREPLPSPAGASADGGEAQLRDALSRASREVIERIVWEVVPQLAETIIREQLDRLVKERQR